MTTTQQEILAGDFIKNLLQNLPKEEAIDTIIKQQSEQKNQFNEKLNINFIPNLATLKLKDLKNFIKGANSKESLPNESLNNCLLYPTILNMFLFQQLILLLSINNFRMFYGA